MNADLLQKGQFPVQRKFITNYLFQGKILMRTKSPKHRKPISLFTIIIIVLVLLSACSSNSDNTPGEELEESASAPLNSPDTNAPDVPVFIAPTGVPSPGQEYYVDPDGSDGNDGSQAAPWETIQHAVDTIQPGDTILLNSGTYAGARIEKSGTADAWMSLKAAPGTSVLINVPGPNNKHDSNLEFETWEGDEIVAYWLVEGLEVADAPNWGIDLRGNEENHSHNFVIRNNRVHDNGLNTGKTGIFFAFIDDVIVEGNESYANGEHGVYFSNSGDRFVVRANSLHDNNNCGLHINGDLESGEDGIISDGLIENNIIFENGVGGCSGINMDGVINAIVRNNLLYQNHAGGISLFQENGAVCSQNIQILNNTIVQAEDGRWAINISDDECINNKIFNNIILTFHEWRGSIVIPSAGISGFESDYNLIMDRFSSDDDDSVITLSEWQAQGYDINSVIASPDELFIGLGDYHLVPSSAAVDAGRTLPGVEFDMEGWPRPQGSAYDIGAFEYPGEGVGQSSSSEQISADIIGSITYHFNGHVYRIAAVEGAQPENISKALDKLSPGSGDRQLNISPDGEWLVLETERFDPECVGWACLAIISADLTTGEAIRANGQVVHLEGISAVASGGNLVVYVAGDGTHERDLWAVSRVGVNWGAPVMLTTDSPYNFNYQPAISEDGSKVVFNCGADSWADKGTAICEVATTGTDFRVVITPGNAPSGFTTTAGLNNPDYAPDGSIVFEADWDSGNEQIWRLGLGETVPVRVTNTFGNDNSPCILPDGSIVSLWLDRPEGNGLHEIKIMSSDGSRYFLILPGMDVLDAGMGCGYAFGDVLGVLRYAKNYM